MQLATMGLWTFTETQDVNTKNITQINEEYLACAEFINVDDYEEHTIMRSDLRKLLGDNIAIRHET